MPSTNPFTAPKASGRALSGDYEVQNESSQKPSPIIYAAILPAVVLLFGIAFCLHFIHPGCAAALEDFEMTIPLSTKIVLWIVGNPALLFAPPFALTVLMVWCGYRKPTTHALSVVIGCAIMAMIAGLLSYVALTYPLVTLMNSLSN